MNKLTHLIFGGWLAATVAGTLYLLPHAGQTQAHAASPITLQDADATACDTYELAKGAHRDAISDLLADAAQRVQRSGCVNIVFVEG